MTKSLLVTTKLILYSVALYTVFTNAKTLETDLIQKITGDYEQHQIEKWIEAAHQITAPIDRVDFFSKQFFDIPYQSNTLIGDEITPEILTNHLSAVDCFTYLDYVTALAHTDSFSDYIHKLTAIRYQNNLIDYQTRNHFFSDWLAQGHVIDVTKTIGKNKAITHTKNLNQKITDGVFLPNISIRTRLVTYIPTDALTNKTLKQIKTGDYLGIYAEHPGLDVTHVGFAVVENDLIKLRHASKKLKKVVEESLLEYLKEKPGLIIYRLNVNDK